MEFQLLFFLENNAIEEHAKIRQATKEQFLPQDIFDQLRLEWKLSFPHLKITKKLHRWQLK
jgi:hypothetical protein